jgi:hypothetical protein
LVSAAYDNLVAIIIVGVIFIGTVVAMPFSTLGTVDQQQLRNAALNVFDSMLLDVGSPSNWGSILSIDSKGSVYFDPTKVHRFGLAYADPFSKFVLDPDKVQRLNEDELGYEKIRDLLNIQDNYGFQFVVYRPFRVTPTLDIDGTENSIHFSVSVTRAEDGTPIPNAEVKVTTFVTATNATDIYDFIAQPITPYVSTTDVTGYCEDTLYPEVGNYVLKYAVAVMEITVSGMATTIVKESDDSITQYIDMRTYGDTVVLSIRGEGNKLFVIGDNGANRNIEMVAAYDSKNVIPIPYDEKSDNVNWGGQNVTLTFPGIRSLNPTVLLIGLIVRLSATPGVPGSGGPTPVLVAGPFGFADSWKVFEVGDLSSSQDPIAVMRRLIVISDMTYVAEISFWRE